MSGVCDFRGMLGTFPLMLYIPWISGFAISSLETNLKNHQGILHLAIFRVDINNQNVVFFWPRVQFEQKVIYLVNHH